MLAGASHEKQHRRHLPLDSIGWIETKVFLTVIWEVQSFPGTHLEAVYRECTTVLGGRLH